MNLNIQNIRIKKKKALATKLRIPCTTKKCCSEICEWICQSISIRYDQFRRLAPDYEMYETKYVLSVDTLAES